MRYYVNLGVVPRLEYDMTLLLPLTVTVPVGHLPACLITVLLGTLGRLGRTKMHCQHEAHVHRHGGFLHADGDRGVYSVM